MSLCFTNDGFGGSISPGFGFMVPRLDDCVNPESPRLVKNPTKDTIPEKDIRVASSDK